MRTHGDKIVMRRSVVEKRTPYGEYLDILREDFAGICGYCGKSEYVTKKCIWDRSFYSKEICTGVRRGLCEPGIFMLWMQ